MSRDSNRFHQSAGKYRSSDEEEKDSSDSEVVVKKKKKKILLKDNARCPVCLQSISIPDNRDRDEYLKVRLQRCIDSSDPICVAALSGEKNKQLLLQIVSR